MINMLKKCTIPKLEELEQIAHDLGGAVKYGREDNLEILSYQDSRSKILARNDLSNMYQKVVFYGINVDHLPQYINLLKGLNVDLSNKIVVGLKERKKTKPLEGIAERVAFESVIVDNFKGIYELICLHREQV